MDQHRPPGWAGRWQTGQRHRKPLSSFSAESIPKKTRFGKYDVLLERRLLYILREILRLGDGSGIASHYWKVGSLAHFRRDRYAAWSAIRCASQWLAQLEGAS
jgi:hypothetical protein